MIISARDDLYARRKSFPRLKPVPFENHEVIAICVNDGDWKNIDECLRSEDSLDIHAALNFLLHVFDRYPFNKLPPDLRKLLIERIPDFMHHQDVTVRYVAQRFFVSLRDCFLDYRNTMLELLSSPDIGDRRNALYNYSTFCRAREIEPLIKFKDDEYAAEVRMGGPYEFEFRNLALETIEKIVAKEFSKPLKEAPFDASTVTWYDWEPFLCWWKENCQLA